MISHDATRTGVAPQALLYSAGFIDIAQPDAAFSSQHIALQGGNDVRAINYSFGFPLGNETLDGNSFLTKYVDWNARQDDVLYVIAGNEGVGGTRIPVPTDNHNGLTVAFSEKNADGVYRNVPVGASGNNFSEDAVGDRTTTDIVAPGRFIEVMEPNNMPATRSGTSYAAPHVTGTIALFQQYGNSRLLAGAAGWDDDAKRHEVSKAVLMNSADKIKDPGDGSFLGMDRTLLDSSGKTWLQSEAFLDADGATPLDDEMGTGHLNALRALQQFAAGEHDPNGAGVPLIGWDYDTTNFGGDMNVYSIDTPLQAGDYFSATLAWDRRIYFSNDGGTLNQYDVGDDFNDADLGNLNWMFLYLVPSGGGLEDAVAMSVTPDDTIQHIFAQIPTTGDYELWVEQVAEILLDDDIPQSYALAWWGAGASVFLPGDFNGDGTVDAADLAQWAGDVGVNGDSDADGDGDSDGADLLTWQRNLGQSSPIGAVPEPATLLLSLGALAALARSRPAARGVLRKAPLRAEPGAERCRRRVKNHKNSRSAY